MIMIILTECALLSSFPCMAKKTKKKTTRNLNCAVFGGMWRLTYVWFKCDLLITVKVCWINIILYFAPITSRHVTLTPFWTRILNFPQKLPQGAGQRRRDNLKRSKTCLFKLFGASYSEWLATGLKSLDILHLIDWFSLLRPWPPFTNMV